MAPRATPLENRIPLAGEPESPRVNLLDIRNPGALSHWARSGSVKEWRSFSIQNGQLFLEVSLGCYGMLQTVKVFLYDKESGETYIFDRMAFSKPVRRQHNAEGPSLEYSSPRFSFDLRSLLNENAVKLGISIEAGKKRPAFYVALSLAMGDADIQPLAVSLSFAQRRSMYAFKSIAAVSGDISLDGSDLSLELDSCTGILRDFKGFFPRRIRYSACAGMAFDGDGRRYGFHMAENQAMDGYNYNENALWLDGNLTPLPPVRITMPGGPESDWVVQDTEGMVDLVFTPKATNRFRRNLLLARGDFFANIGHYNGMLTTSNGNQLEVRNLCGMSEKLYLRV